jgi:putative endonuclease
LGKHGELQAETFLLQHAFSILDRNYRHGHGEIDLVAFDPATQEIVFVEVKTRSSLEYGDPSLAVAYKKRQTLYQTALDWIQTNHRPEDFRFDVIAITPQTVDYYPNISW